jgi:hypothetical protein
VEEGDAGRDDQVGPREGGREAAELLYPEGLGEGEVVLGEADLLGGFAAGDLVYVGGNISQWSGGNRQNPFLAGVGPS